MAKASQAPEARAVLLSASREPMPGVAHPGTHQLYRHPRVSLVARALGDVPAGHVRAQMLYAGICGTDLHFISADPQTGYLRSSVPASIPAEGRVIGHEGVGRITAVGAGVQGLEPGMLVAFESVLACGNCDVCRRGSPNQCRSSKLLGTQMDGIFAEQCDVPAILARPITPLGDSDMALKTAACLEPAAVAWLACAQARLAPGERVLVQGAGPIGHFAAMLARTVFGASRVEVLEPSAFRRGHVGPFADATHADPASLEAGRRFDVLIEASGDLPMTDSLLTRLDANGRLCLLARSGRPLVLSAMDHIISYNITILGVRGHLGGIFEKLMALVAEGRLPLHGVVTGVVDGVEALATALADPAAIARDHCKLLCRF